MKNNLQTVASLLRLQARRRVDPRKALDDSVNRILAIAAVHEVLTERRDDEVDLAELLDRLRAMLVQGLGSGKDVTNRVGAGLARGRRDRARARLQRAAPERAAAGGDSVRIELARRNGSVVLTIADDGAGLDDAAEARASRSCARSCADELRARCAQRCERTQRSGFSGGHSRRPACRSTKDASEKHFQVIESGRSGRLRTIGEMSLRGSLIAEDETIIRLDLRALLERAGFEVVRRGARRRGSRRARAQGPPDLAIMDVKMPKLDGIEAARRILEERPIPIVMLTAYGQEELVSRAVEAGVFGYLVKPFREQDLLPAIQTARARHEELAALREEADSLAEALAARKVIERAKGLLMAKENLSEQEAFARLRKASQVSGRPLKVVAEAVVASLPRPGSARRAAPSG